MKKVIIFIDYESKYGMPFSASYDLTTATKNILSILEKYNAKGTFNICGQLAIDDAPLICSISDRGHEISVHGMRHEQMAHMSLTQIEGILNEAEHAIVESVGTKPVGFRGPYMLGPVFYREDIYKLLEKRGYIWASNRHTAMSNRVFPRLIPAKIRSYTMPFINPSLVLRDHLNNPTGKKRSTVKWLLGDRDAFYRGNILEIPDSSSLDCSLIGLPDPNMYTSQRQIDRAIAILKQQFDESKNLFCLNLHDWIIGTANRTEILDEVMKYISSNRTSEIVTAKHFTKSNEK